jgi:hypothetical protein
VKLADFLLNHEGHEDWTGKTRPWISFPTFLRGLRDLRGRFLSKNTSLSKEVFETEANWLKFVGVDKVMMLAISYQLSALSFQEKPGDFLTADS